MKVDRKNVDYLLGSAAKRLRGEGGDCPSCGGQESDAVSGKFIVTQLRRCADCRLLFRSPTTSVAENAEFYQRRYEQGFTTELPPESELKSLVANRFRNTEKDYGRFVEILLALGVRKGARLLDFGCSWGYGSWQLAQAGYHVESFEVSIPRGDYARERLGCTVHSDLATVDGAFDVFFSSHVIEHVPSVKAALEFADAHLHEGGTFLAFTPNGASAHRDRDPKGWQQSWGNVHPNLLDDQFYAHHFAGRRLLLGSDPYDLEGIRSWAAGDPRSTTTLDLSGGELMCVMRT